MAFHHQKIPTAVGQGSLDPQLSTLVARARFGGELLEFLN
jgi:hypothetical protein